MIDYFVFNHLRAEQLIDSARGCSHYFLIRDFIVLWDHELVDFKKHKKTQTKKGWKLPKPVRRAESILVRRLRKVYLTNTYHQRDSHNWVLLCINHRQEEVYFKAVRNKTFVKNRKKDRQAENTGIKLSTSKEPQNKTTAKTDKELWSYSKRYKGQTSIKWRDEVLELKTTRMLPEMEKKNSTRGKRICSTERLPRTRWKWFWRHVRGSRFKLSYSTSCKLHGKSEMKTTNTCYAPG